MATNKEINKLDFAIPKENYKHLLIGFGVVVLGFILMIGGASDDPTVFNREIFSFTRITVSPVIILTGFIYIGWAIMRKTKKSND